MGNAGHMNETELTENFSVKT